MSSMISLKSTITTIYKAWLYDETKKNKEKDDVEDRIGEELDQEIEVARKSISTILNIDIERIYKYEQDPEAKFFCKIKDFPEFEIGTFKVLTSMNGFMGRLNSAILGTPVGRQIRQVDKKEWAKIKDQMGLIIEIKEQPVAASNLDIIKQDLKRFFDAVGRFETMDQYTADFTEDGYFYDEINDVYWFNANGFQKWRQSTSGFSTMKSINILLSQVQCKSKRMDLPNKRKVSVVTVRGSRLE